MAIKLVIDSASDINKEEADKLGVIMLPMEINFGEQSFYDGVNLLPEQFYSKLESEKNLPKTSQINSFRWEEEFRKQVEDGNEVIVITISSKLSGTYESACRASESFSGKVRVVDSLNACTGERLLGLYALKLINQGLNLNEIEALLNANKTKINVSAVIDTLEYLKKGGRISSAVALAGTLLSIKPLISVIDGEVKVVAKAMGTKRAYMELNKLINNKEINQEMPMGFIYSGLNSSSLENYLKMASIGVNQELNEIKAYNLGATIGTHIGAGAVGFAFFEK